MNRKLITQKILRSFEYYETTKKEFYFINGGKVDYESQDELESLKPNTIVEATHSFTVKTGLDETVNTVQPGDFIKIGPLGEIYVIPEKKFDKLYEMKDGQYVPTKSPRTVTVWTGEPSEIVAPWGETMIVNPGDIIVQESKEEDKYYRVAREAFDKEYNMPEELLKAKSEKERKTLSVKAVAKKVGAFVLIAALSVTPILEKSYEKIYDGCFNLMLNIFAICMRNKS